MVRNMSDDEIAIENKRFLDYIRAKFKAGSSKTEDGKTKGEKRQAEPDWSLVNHEEFLVEYAKSDRGKCFKCEKNIEKDSIRLGKLVYAAETHYNTGLIPRWHHVDCFVEAQQDLMFFGQIDKIKQFSDLKEEDQKILKEQVKPVKISLQNLSESKKTYSRQMLKSEEKVTEEKRLKTQPDNCDLLTPGRMLNDTIVEFYMNYLMDGAQPDIKKQVHLFSSFFYNMLKNVSSENAINRSYKRWDKHVRLFDKDFLIIPICDHHHWVLVIICFAYKVPAHDDPIVINPFNVNKQEKACILIFDSLGYKYLTKFTDPIRKFLHSRWQYERPNEEHLNFKDRTALPEYNAKVPRQRNMYDCGIYLLNSFEKFLKDPKKNCTSIRDGIDLSFSWCIDPTQKRKQIRSLMQEVDSSKTTISI